MGLIVSEHSDDHKSRLDISDVGSSIDSTIYKLEIMTIELFSVYGKQVRPPSSVHCIQLANKGQIDPCMTSQSESGK